MSAFKITSAVVLLSSTLLVTACSSHKIQPQESNPAYADQGSAINTADTAPTGEETELSPRTAANTEQAELTDLQEPMQDPLLEPTWVPGPDTLSDAAEAGMIDESLADAPLAYDDMAADPIREDANQSDADTRPAKTLFLFGFDQKRLGSEAESALRQHGEFLAAHPDLKISINGHADPQGDPAYNQYLASQRARYVADLLAQQGVKPEQMEVLSWGADSPAPAAIHNRDNRRVELIYNEEYLVNYQAQ